MKRLFIFLIFYFIGGYLFAQKDVWYLKCDTLTNECGYIDNKGEIMIPFGEYHRFFTDTMQFIAIVGDDLGRIFAINKKNEKIFNVFIVDNGPDYPREGLFRIVDGDKIGFANLKGEIVIKPRYTAVFPFFAVLAPFCVGCEEKLDPIIHEYSYWTGGKWGFMDRNGKVVINPQYDSISYKQVGDININLAVKGKHTYEIDYDENTKTLSVNKIN